MAKKNKRLFLKKKYSKWKNPYKNTKDGLSYSKKTNIDYSLQKLKLKREMNRDKIEAEKNIVQLKNNLTERQFSDIMIRTLTMSPKEQVEYLNAISKMLKISHTNNNINNYIRDYKS